MISVKIYRPFIFSFIGLVLLASSCNFGNDSNKVKEIPKAERIQIYQNYFSDNPEYSFQLNGKLYFFDVINDAGKKRNALIIMNKVGSFWNDSLKIFLSGATEDYYCVFDSVRNVEINGTPYLYYEENIPGGSMGNYSVQFTLLDLNSYSTYSKSFSNYYIRYDYLPDASTGTNKFEQSNSLSGNNELLKFLQNRVDSSPKIYQPNAQEKLARSFLISNESQIYELKQHLYTDSAFQFKKRETDEKVFSTDYNEILNDHGFQSTAQNLHYIVVAYFKGPVIGYDKLTKKYFCIWAPTQSDWMIDLNFRDNGKLYLKDRNLLIDLDDFTYSYPSNSTHGAEENAKSVENTSYSNEGGNKKTLYDWESLNPSKKRPKYILGVLYYTVTDKEYVPEKTIGAGYNNLTGEYDKGLTIPGHWKDIKKEYYVSVSSVEKVENLTNDKKYQFLDAVEQNFRMWKNSPDIYKREVLVYDTYSAASIARQNLLNQ